MPDDVPVIFVGAGPAGLSTAGALARLGIRATVLERDAEVSARWAERYDRLRLHTIKRFSGLAHHPLPRGLPRYVAKDEFARYLRDYAARLGLDVRLDTDVSRIRRDGDGWAVEAPAAAFRAPIVVIATGKYDAPVVPEWPGRETFHGSLVHSSAYRSGADYAGQDVLVAGFGNTGAEIAADLVESGANRVAVSVRTSPPIARRDVVGIPIQLLGMAASVLPPRAADRIASALRRVTIGDLSRYGLGPAEWGPFTARRPPIIDVGFLRQLRARRVEILPAVERLTEREVVFADGRRRAVRRGRRGHGIQERPRRPRRARWGARPSARRRSALGARLAARAVRDRAPGDRAWRPLRDPARLARARERDLARHRLSVRQP